MFDLVEEVWRRATELPDSEVSVIQQARRRGLEAVDIVTAAVKVDPTLLEADRCRNIDLLAELLRQLKPLARQAETELHRRRLAADPATAEQARRLGRTNPQAPDELDALSQHAVQIARRVADTALPDWNTPHRIRERSAQLLPSAEVLKEIADRLRRAVQPALLYHPDPEAVRLAALADQIAPRQDRPHRCQAPGCARELKPAPTGRPRRYCGAVCRQRARRHQLRITAAARPGDNPAGIIVGHVEGHVDGSRNANDGRARPGH